MSFLSKILIKTTTNVVKNTARFELAVDDLASKFEDSCPPKDELLKIVQQKNQIQTALENINASFNALSGTVSTTETLVTTVDTAVKVIKAIPIPTSVPPGVGIPVNVITILADSLDTLGDLLKGAKGALGIVPSISGTITSSLTSVIRKLQELDVLLNNCIDELAEGLDEQGKNDLIVEIGNVAATAGNNVDIAVNAEDELGLEGRLKPDAINKYYYRKPGFKFADWLLTLEYNEENDFDFPQRRIRCTNVNESPDNIYRFVTVFNNGDNNAYSYSNSVRVLLEEAKFVIDSLDNNWWRRNNPEFPWPVEAINRDNINIANNDVNTGSANPPPPVDRIIGSSRFEEPYDMTYGSQQLTGTINIETPNTEVVLETFGGAGTDNYIYTILDIGPALGTPGSSISIDSFSPQYQTNTQSRIFPVVGSYPYTFTIIDISEFQSGTYSEFSLNVP